MTVTIPGYQIVETLHVGSISLVYRAQQESTQRPVVLKLLRDDYPSPRRIAWFKREYELISALNLDGVIGTHALEGGPYRFVMVLEDFGGRPLNDFLQDGPLPLEQFFSIALQLVQTLGILHQRAIVHKDINPANVLLNPETGQIKLIDFGISTVLSRETPTLRRPTMLEGTLAYISPEQTGRMNRGLDYRTDFYSLGVTFYHMLTGQLPFPLTDAASLVHAHIAQEAIAPHVVRPEIPLALSAVVMKLMEKSAEERYQSAHGLLADLERCQAAWQQGETRAIPFELGEQDWWGEFQLPEKLYGRDHESDLLLRAFERVAQGNHALALVTGYSGVGKTALVQELYKPITARRGLFSAGKFDQLQRDIPYSAFVQALQSLVSYLLSGSEQEVADWRTRLEEALESNGAVLTALLPNLELIIGEQPEVPSLPPVETQNRLTAVLQQFLGVLATAEHPLVLFLDDLQWADSASLKLLERLLIIRPSYLMVVGAYRDQEVSATHPLRQSLASLEEENVPITTLPLVPLALPHILHLLQDSVMGSEERLRPLAELLLAKTEGNPFFMGEFLKALHDEGLLVLDRAQGIWQWDIEQLRRRNMTDNVLELMKSRVERLSEASQRVLQIAACIGNRFDLETLSLVYGQSAKETAAALWEALREELVRPLDDEYQLASLEVDGLTLAPTYHFAHDQIQQTVYSLMDAAERERVHWQIGQQMLRTLSEEEREQKLFEIVDQLNYGRGLIQQSQEREEVMRLNLRAGRRALASAAYPMAFDYLQAALEQTTEEDWESAYDFCLDLHVAAMQAAYLNVRPDEMERIGEAGLAHARTLLDQIAFYEVRLNSYSAQFRVEEVTQLSLQVLKSLGVDLPDQPGPEDMGPAFGAVMMALGERTPEALLDREPMQDGTEAAVLRLLGGTMVSVMVSRPMLFPIMGLKQVELSILHGNAPESATAYMLLAHLLSVMGNIEMGYRFAQLADDLIARYDLKAQIARVWCFNQANVYPWKEPISSTLRPLLEAHHAGVETGDFQHAAMSLYFHCYLAYFCGEELTTLDAKMTEYAQVIRRLGQETTLAWHEQYHQGVLNLMGRGTGTARMSGPLFDAEQMSATDLGSIYNSTLNRLMLACFFQDVEEGVRLIDQLEPLIQHGGGAIMPYTYFYGALARAAAYPTASADEQQALMAKLNDCLEKLLAWSQFAPTNYLHKHHLIDAERLRLLGEAEAAQERYTKAIELAREHGFMHEEALAYERAAQLFLDRGQTSLATYYLRDAHYAYLRWGAFAKVKEMEQRHPSLVAHGTRTPFSTLITTSTTVGSFNMLDLISVLKASQAISGEIVLERLLHTLMRLVIENGGAERGYLLLPRDGQWMVEASGGAGTEGTTLHTTAITSEVDGHPILPVSVVNYVARTRDNVVLSHAAEAGQFMQDPYIVATHPKSVLCVPLANQNKLTGILYLENNRVTGAFTPDRIEVLSFLSAQAAISIENAQLYSNIQALSSAYERFVPRQFLGFLEKKSITEVRLGDQIQKEMTILFSDIRDFTPLSETMTPSESFAFVNEYLSRMEPIITSQQGFIDKYMGDGIMALFPRDADSALRAALSMLETLRTFNAEREAKGLIPIDIGIGLHTGLLMMGTVGGHNRMDGTVISDAVNLGSRLEGLTKRFGVPLLITEQTRDHLSDPSQYTLRPIGQVRVKGKSIPIPVYEVLDALPPHIQALKSQMIDEFAEALNLFHAQDFDAALEQLTHLLGVNPDDKIAALFAERCRQFKGQELPDHWEILDSVG